MCLNCLHFTHYSIELNSFYIFRFQQYIAVHEKNECSVILFSLVEIITFYWLKLEEKFQILWHFIVESYKVITILTGQDIVKPKILIFLRSESINEQKLKVF